MRLSSLPNYLDNKVQISDYFPYSREYYKLVKDELTTQMCFEKYFWLHGCWLLLNLCSSISNQVIMIPRCKFLGERLSFWIDQHQTSGPSIAVNLIGLSDLLCWLLEARNCLCKLNNTKHLSQQAFVDFGVLQTFLPNNTCSWYIWNGNNTEINMSGKLIDGK